MAGFYPGPFKWQFYPVEGRFSLQTEAPSQVQLNHFCLGIHFHCRGKRYHWRPDHFQPVRAISSDTSLPIENETVEVLTASQSESGLRVNLTLANAHNHRWGLWKLSLYNEGSDPVWIAQIDLLDGSNPVTSHPLVLGSSPLPLRFYLNGWQSWSYTGTLNTEQSMPRSRLGPFQNPMVLNAGTPIFHRRGQFSSDFFTMLLNPFENVGLVVGFLSQQQHFGSLVFSTTPQPHLRVWANGDHTRLAPGKSMETDWLAAYPFAATDSEFPLESYLKAVAAVHGIDEFPPSPRGWCSWYYYYTNISEEDIRENLLRVQSWRSEVPLDLVQIDDGFESQVGDWLTFKSSFPHGVAPLAQEIREAGLQAGLWLAPFIVHPQSQLARQHPEWLLRKPSGRPVNAGFVWNTFATALDLTVPQALEYAAQVVHTAVYDWGFPYLKLDFLYAAALPGRYHQPTLTRAQVLRRGMETLRQATGTETFLLGCGAPLGSVLGLVNAMRIGADISGSWQPEYLGHRWFFKGEPHMPAAHNAIRNTLTRAPLHRRWWINDPDCLLLRPDTRLTLPEVQTLASVIALSGGSLLLSDNLTTLPIERIRIAQVLLPLIEERPEVLDLLETDHPAHIRLDLTGAIGEWHLLAFINWSDETVTPHLTRSRYRLPASKPYLLHDFWTDRHHIWEDDTTLELPPLAPHGISLLAAFPLPDEQPAWAGSTLHISQGLEARTWHIEETHLTCRLDLQHAATGSVYLYLPEFPRSAWLEGETIQWSTVSPSLYRFPVYLTQAATLNVAWK